MRRLSVIAAAAVAALGVLVLAGCGGIDKGKLESAIKSQTTDQLKARGSSLTAESVHCTKTSDDYHFSCVLTASDGSKLDLVASCNHDGKCTWKRA